MPRIVIGGLACSTFLILLSSSAVPQEARAGADAGLGQLIFNNACRTCHTTKEGDNRLGPNLHNIIGRKAGSLPTFGYSSAMKGADFVWDKEKLDDFIAKPDGGCARQQHEAVWRARVGRGPHQVDYFLAIPHRRLKATSVFMNLSLRVRCARTTSQSAGRACICHANDPHEEHDFRLRSRGVARPADSMSPRESSRSCSGRNIDD